MKISKKGAYKKVEFYAREITKKQPYFNTVFRIYYDSLQKISKILHHIEENPWHPENDYAEEIFESMQELFDELEELNKKANKD